MYTLKHFGLLTIVSSFVVGCATTPTDPSQPLTNYTVIGRAALKAPENSGQASFNWTQKSPDNVKLIVQGPLGNGRIELMITPTQSVLTTDDGTYRDSSPDLLFAQATGSNWPISGMRSWIVGQPHLENTFTYKDADERISSFYEDGWTIEYKKWSAYKQRELPQVIEITRNDIRLRLLVEHWKY